MNPNRTERSAKTTESGTTPDLPSQPAPVPSPSPEPPRAISWWLLLTIVIIAIASGWIGMKFGTRFTGAIGTVASDVESANVPAKADGSDTGGAKSSKNDETGATQYYTCGMHPWVILPKPGDCPICHMKLTPLDPSKFTGEVAIDPVVVQNIGVRVDPVTKGPLVRTIRTVGNVDYDETRVRDINTKISGWIEHLYVDYVGAPVKQGERLFDVYSPVLYQAQEEYLLALKTQRATGTSQEDRRSEPLDLVQAAKTKLELFDVTHEQIDALTKAGKPSRTMTVLSPYEGVVIAKHANEGMKIDPGMQVFRIADLSRVWVQVTIYESQLPYVSEGERAVMTLPYIPGQTFEGRVTYIDPYVNTRTREVQVRLEFENPTGLLKPGMFATVELRSTLRENAVLAPRSAIISTGERNVAFVSLGEGRFEPRNIRLGAETGGGTVEILDGLRPGELVVTSGQFLLDSESRVREALAKMIRGNLASDQQAEVAVVGKSELDALPESVAADLSDALRAYFTIGNQLASDTTQGIREPARSLAAALDRLIGATIPSHEHFWHKHTEVAVARGAALGLASETDLSKARETFADLSVALDTLVRATGIPPGFKEQVQSLHCPMFREGQGGAIWLQAAGSPRNPFFGSVMLKCFDRRETLPETGHAKEHEGAEPGSDQDGTSAATPERPASLDAAAGKRLTDAIDAYLEAEEHLTKNEFDQAVAALEKMRSSLEGISGLPLEAAAAVKGIESALEGATPDPTTLRTRFAHASNALLQLAQAAPIPNADGLFHAYCPMVKENWVQRGKKIRNPYDPAMLSCGVIKGTLDGRAAQ